MFWEADGHAGLIFGITQVVIIGQYLNYDMMHST